MNELTHGGESAQLPKLSLLYRKKQTTTLHTRSSTPSKTQRAARRCWRCWAVMLTCCTDVLRGGSSHRIRTREDAAKPARDDKN
jgi:hypothetical protein